MAVVGRIAPVGLPIADLRQRQAIGNAAGGIRVSGVAGGIPAGAYADGSAAFAGRHGGGQRQRITEAAIGGCGQDRRQGEAAGAVGYLPVDRSIAQVGRTPAATCLLYTSRCV